MSDEVDGHLVVLVTGRLTLSVPPLSHAPQSLAFLVRNHAHMAPWAPPPRDPVETEETCRRRIEESRRDALAGTAFRWRCRWRDDPDGPVVGTVSLTRVERGPLERASLGFAVDLDQQGKGLVVEAVGAVIDFAANTLGLRFLEAGHAPQNLRSSATLRRIGFVPYGYARDYLHVGGRVQDHVLLQYDLRPHRR